MEELDCDRRGSTNQSFLCNTFRIRRHILTTIQKPKIRDRYNKESGRLCNCAALLQTAFHGLTPPPRSHWRPTPQNTGIHPFHAPSSNATGGGPSSPSPQA